MDYSIFTYGAEDIVIFGVLHVLHVLHVLRVLRILFYQPKGIRRACAIRSGLSVVEFGEGIDQLDLQQLLRIPSMAIINTYKYINAWDINAWERGR